MLATWAHAAERGAALPYTTMVWVVRTPAILEPFEEVLRRLASDPQNFELRLHCTKASEADAAAAKDAQAQQERIRSNLPVCWPKEAQAEML